MTGRNAPAGAPAPSNENTTLERSIRAVSSSASERRGPAVSGGGASGRVSSGPRTVLTSLDRSSGSPVRILVVDGEDLIRDLLVRTLRYEGCDVRATATGG